ncbi:Ger(x)C family spore germination protein [Neobacillus terrae]|uniref:Ger(x)C family spore germination protein n=1 Tax=Neobacillus terrae TaxID=3034837 RepID=UPI001409C0D7|nr:Ger(x)C family spore germination protein [Neobacillus terrae]NHM32049.1 Ger(x)C family spore germination protein [Neobacillus terrae]
MKRTWKILLMIISAVPFLGGCWNQKELTDLAFVMALGVDRGENGHGYKLTFQIVNPGNVTTGQMGGGGGLPIAVYKSSGVNLTDASRNATKEVSRQLYYAHTNVVVISEKLAKKEGISNILDALDRDPVFRTTTQIIIARGTTAEEMLSTLTILDKLPVNNITKSLDVTENMLGENTKITIDDFISGFVSKGKHPIANGFTLVGKKNKGKYKSNIDSTIPEVIIKTDGLAIFKKGKLTGWIDGKEARGAVWVLDKVKGTDVNIDWNGKNNAINLITLRSKTKVTAIVKNDKPVITVSIENEGNVSQADLPIKLTDPDVIGKIERKMEKSIQKEVLGTIKAAQKQRSDIFGFGDVIHRTDPKLWKQLSKDWDNRFADLQVNVKVDSYLRRSGIRTNPFSVDLK